MTSKPHDQPGQADRALRWIILAAVAALVGVVIALARLQIDRTPTVEAGRANLSALWPFWITSAAAWAALGALWWRLARRATRRDGPAAPPPPWRLLGKASLLILLVALAARGAVIFTHDPALSDDIDRYIFDGRNGAAGINPYLPTPAERMDIDHLAGAEWDVHVDPAWFDRDGFRPNWPGEADVLPLVNNNRLHTIYLPTSQWVFTLFGLAVIEPWSSPAASARIFRAGFVALEMLAIFLVLLMLRSRGRSPWWAALYAWHPLPLAEIAGSGHQDVIGVLLLLAALWLFRCRPQRVWGWTAALALATIVKPVVVPVAAIMLKGRSWRAWLASLLLGGAVCAAISAPLLLTEHRTPLDHLAQTAERFGLKWAHFGSVYEPVLFAIEQATNDPAEAWERPQAGLWTNDEQERLARTICLGLVVLVIVAVLLSRLDAWAGARAILLAMVLFSSSAQPWYLLWALALGPLAMSPALWMASLTLLWGYAQLGDVVAWRVSPWLLVAAYAPVYAALAVDVARGASGGRFR